MQLIQRLGNNISDEYIDNYIKLILDNPGSCDNVWIPTSYGFPPLEKHKKFAEFWTKSAEKFRKNGIGVSMQISNTIGHGMQISSDCTGLVYEGSPVEKIVDFNGTSAERCFCWRGENFLRYIIDSMSYYVEGIKPESVWIDDDFRAINHSPVKFGCFCDNCMEKFNTLHNTSFSREQLVDEILYGEAKWRENFVKFLRDGMYDFMYKLGKVIHRLSPHTVLGYQSCSNGGYDGCGSSYIYDAMKDSTGYIPLSRPGGGITAYVDHNPNILIEKSLHISWQNATLPDYVKCKCPEIENLPFTAFGKTHAGTAFESSLYFASGNTDMSYSMMMHVKESFEWYNSEFSLLAKHRKYWEALSECNKNTYQAGMQYFMSEEMWKKQLNSGEGFEEINKEPITEIMPCLRDGYPVSYDRKEESLFIIHPEAAKLFTKEDIEYLMSKNVLTDAESLGIFIEKGFDFGVRVYKADDIDALRMNTKFSGHAVNPKAVQIHSQSYHAQGRTGVYTMIPDDDDKLEIIAVYNSSADIKRYSNDDSMPYGVAEAVLTTSHGGRWGVLGYSPWKTVIPFYKREQILDIADYISSNALCARIMSPVQAMLLPRKDENGKTACVSIVNCTIGESGEIKLRIRNPKGEKFVFMSQYNGEKILEFTKDTNDYIVSVPSVSPWSVGTIFCFSE